MEVGHVQTAEYWGLWLILVEVQFGQPFTRVAGTAQQCGLLESHLGGWVQSEAFLEPGQCEVRLLFVECQQAAEVVDILHAARDVIQAWITCRSIEHV